MSHILAIRFSSLGDIAMTVPVLNSFAKRYPEHQITLLSRTYAAPLFEHTLPNVHFMGVELKEYDGMTGLYKLYDELQSQKFDAVADLHDVLRSIVLRAFFKRAGVAVAYINKNRHERQQLIRTRHRELEQLISQEERYAIVLAELGFPFSIEYDSIFLPKVKDLEAVSAVTGQKENFHWIGIAPFAAHKGKIYPLSQMEKVIHSLSQKKNVKVFLFGAGKKESQWCEKWSKTYPNTTSLIGRFSLSEEMALISHLDVMLTMDSANMHLASLMQTPVVSIWGATHPFAGFAGHQTAGSRMLQKDLPCRPCSIFGKKKCSKGTYECLWSISSEEIVSALLDTCHSPQP